MTSSTGRFTRDRPVRESRTLVNMRNQPHCDNGEGVAMPRPYPLVTFFMGRAISWLPTQVGKVPLQFASCSIQS